MSTFYLRLALAWVFFSFALPAETPTGSFFSDDEYQKRLNSIACVFEYKLTPTVKERILHQVGERGKRTTELILGMKEISFPVIDRTLAQHGLPVDLGYVAWIESHFNAAAISPQGAGGPWQFMPGTAALYGLKMDKYVDERLDLRKSSAAAARLFARLFLDYGDWALALAAYNCGSLKVNKAIKSAGSNNYWDICKYLPVETQAYVPRFIAAAYIGSFYSMHELHPTEMPSEYSMTDTVTIHEAMSFEKLSKETGIPVETIRFLNPSFLRGTVPASAKGHVLVLPVNELARWRGFPSTTSYAGESLAGASSPAPAAPNAAPLVRQPFQGPVQFQKVAAPTRPPGTPPSASEAAAMAAQNRFSALGSCVITCVDGFAYYVVQPGETIRDIIKRCPAVKLAEVQELNGQQAINHLQAGDFIKIGRIR